MTSPDLNTPLSKDIHIIKTNDKHFILVGTAHISKNSAQLVEESIEYYQPDCVCLELDQKRYEALIYQKKWENLNLIDIIKQKKLGMLIAQLILSSYQMRMGKEINNTTGIEMLAGYKKAKAKNIPIELCDREIGVTLKRAWRKTHLFKKAVLISHLFSSIFDNTKIDENQLEELKKQNLIDEMMHELGKQLPSIKEVVIDERDLYLAHKIFNSNGKVILAILGAGHINGIKKIINQNKISKINIKNLDALPPTNPFSTIIVWSLPLLIIGALITIGIQKDMNSLAENVIYWFAINSIFSGVLAIIALPNIITLLVAFLASPFTSLVPIIGVGYLCALTQCILSPPTVKDLKLIKTDFKIIKKWWKNKALKIILVTILSSLGSTIGSLLGGLKISTDFIEVIKNFI